MRGLGRGQQGGWGNSWWLGVMLCGLAALLLGPHKADRQRIFNAPVPHTISDLSWGQAREEDAKETWANSLQSDAANRGIAAVCPVFTSLSFLFWVLGGCFSNP